jgi:hypothetical protein
LVAFLRGVPYRRFLAYNAGGGLVWVAGSVLPGYLAGNSNAAVERTFGHAVALIAAALGVIGFVASSIRRRRRERAVRRESGTHRQSVTTDVAAQRCHNRPVRPCHPRRSPAYLARYKALSRSHTDSDLRVFLRWCTDRELDPLASCVAIRIYSLSAYLAQT